MASKGADVVSDAVEGNAGSTRADRSTRILELVMDRERIEVGELADLVGVSQVTVRKDLDELAARGLLRREHGFAVAGTGDDLRARLAVHYAAKLRIAEEAAALVADGETIMIESGSVCALLAEQLCAQRRGVTIVTNSAFIAEYVRRLPGANVILLGGTYQPESQALVGPIATAAAAALFVDKLFIGVDGYTPDGGFTGKDIMRAETVRAMAGRARQVIVLSESGKFPRQGAVRLLPAAAVARVVTDVGLRPELVGTLESAGVVVQRVTLA